MFSLTSFHLEDLLQTNYLCYLLEDQAVLGSCLGAFRQVAYLLVLVLVRRVLGLLDHLVLPYVLEEAFFEVAFRLVVLPYGSEL